MKNLLYSTIAIFTLCLVTTTKAQDKFTTENADAIFENVVHEFIINEDSSSIYNYSNTIKLLTYQSFQRLYGESFIVYNPDFQKLKIRKSETTMADGITKVESPANAFNEVLPRFAAHAAPYMHYKEMVVTHIGLEKNAVIDFSYSIETKKGFMPGVQGKIFLRGRSPIKNMEVRVVVPKGRNINYFLLNQKLEPEVQNMARWTVYKWNFKDIPMLEEESNQPYWGEFTPTLFVSTPDKEEVAAFLSENYEDLIAPSEAISQKTEEITKDCKDNLSKIEAMHSYVVNNVGGTYISPEVLGYKPYCAKSIYKNNVGSQLDKAILLTSMAKAAGIEAVPILASNYKTYTTDIALLEQFRDIYVHFPVEQIFKDPTEKTHQYLPYNLYGKAYFSLKNPLEIIEAEKAADSYISFESEISINKDLIISGQGEYEGGGYFKHEIDENCFKKELKSFFSNANFNVDEDIKISDFTKDKANKANIAFTEGKPEEIAEGLYYIELPGSNHIVDKFHLDIGSEKRQTEAKVETAYEEEYNYIITIPENLRVVNLSKADISVKNSAGELDCTISAKGNKITVKRFLQFKESIIKPENYKDYSELLSLWKQEKYKRLYFKKK